MPPNKSLLPSPAQLSYSEIDPNLPQLILEISNEEQRRDFRYAMAGMFSGAILAILVFGGFVYLVIRGHTAAAGSLLGVGVLNMVQGFVRTRLRK